MFALHLFFSLCFVQIDIDRIRCENMCWSLSELMMVINDLVSSRSKMSNNQGNND